MFTISGDKAANIGRSSPVFCYILERALVLIWISVADDYSGMVMAIHISSAAERLQVIAGYESGHTMVFERANSKSTWQTVYRCQPHSQPGTLSLISHVAAGT